VLSLNWLSIIICLIIYEYSPEYVKAIEGEGMPKGQESSGNLTKGNLYIHFQIEFPQYLDSKQKKQISEALH
jgi:DnaJ-class molecular chaperone